ncbi:hypothetical protein CLM85_28895, partial [Streptomyces albidoflavus]
MRTGIRACQPKPPRTTAARRVGPSRSSSRHHEVVGLRQRLSAEGLTEACTIVEQDYMTLPASGDFQLVMASHNPAQYNG